MLPAGDRGLRDNDYWENITLRDLLPRQRLCGVEPQSHKPFELGIPTISSSCTWICLWTSAIWNSTSPAQRERGRQGTREQHSTAQAFLEQRNREERSRELEGKKEETRKARERERETERPQRAKLMQQYERLKHTGHVTRYWDNGEHDGSWFCSVQSIGKQRNETITGDDKYEKWGETKCLKLNSGSSSV